MRIPDIHNHVIHHVMCIILEINIPEIPISFRILHFVSSIKAFMYALFEYKHMLYTHIGRVLTIIAKDALKDLLHSCSTMLYNSPSNFAFVTV